MKTKQPFLKLQVQATENSKRNEKGYVNSSHLELRKFSFFFLFFLFSFFFFFFFFFFFLSPPKVKICLYRQNFSCGVYISTNESKVNFFNAIMYPSFEGSDRGGGGVPFFGGGVPFFTRCFSIHKESIILYPRISSGVLAVSDYGHSM